MPKDEFSYEVFFKLWKDYADSQEKSGNKIISTAMSVEKPKLEGFKIICTVATRAVKNQFDLIAADLHKHLREKLNNYSLQVITPVTELENIKVAFTPREKYVYMLELNPKLEEFTKKLGLDLL